MLVRRVVMGLMVVALGLGVWALWPREGDGSTTTTAPVAVDTTTTTSMLPVTTTVAGTTTTTMPMPRVVETVEEAEAILRELWFGWFEGIYHQDEERIREVVATDRQVETARNAFGGMEFAEEPTPGGLVFSDIQILRSDEDCLVVWSSVTAEFRVGGTEGVDVIRWRDESWVRLSSWVQREDLWEQDCEAVLLPFSQ